MRILITHANGFMGSHLIDYLLENQERNDPNLKIMALFSPRTPTRKNLKHLGTLPSEKIELRETSCLKKEAIEAAVCYFEPELTFHFERFTRPGHAWESPQEAFELNVSATVNLLSAFTKINPSSRIVIESSAAIYGNVSSSDLPLKESSPFHLSEKSGPYEWSVAAQECFIRQFVYENHLNIVVGRSFNIEGPRRRTGFVTSDFAAQIAQLELSGDPQPTIKVGNLSARRDWTHVRDAVRAYWLLAERGKAGEVYNVGSGVIKSINEILTSLLGFSNLKDYKLVQDPRLTRPTDIPMLQADYTKIKEGTGWQPTIPYGQLMQEILNDWRRRVREHEYDQ